MGPAARLGLACAGCRPSGIDIEKDRRYLASVWEVSKVHGLHVWGMSATVTALTAHLVIPAAYPGVALRNKVCVELRLVAKKLMAFERHRARQRSARKRSIQVSAGFNPVTSSW